MSWEPLLAIEGEHAAGNEAVDMQVRPQLLVPGVQDHGDAERAAQVVPAELEQRLSRRPEQQLEHGPLILLLAQDERIELVREGEHMVEIRDWQQFSLPRFPPLRFDQGLTFGTMSMPARVISQALKAAWGAAFPMPAPCGRAAGLDGLQDLQMRSGQGVGVAIGWTV
jgi:hypothetical protein